MTSENVKNVRFPRAPDPLAPFLLAGGGGWRAAKTLEGYAFLAFRQLLALAEGQQCGTLSLHDALPILDVIVNFFSVPQVISDNAVDVR